MNIMRICMLILFAISCLGGSIYSAYMTIVLHKNYKKTGTVLLTLLAILFFVIFIILIKAI